MTVVKGSRADACYLAKPVITKKAIPIVAQASSPASSGTVPVPVRGCKFHRSSRGETPPTLAAETAALHLMRQPCKREARQLQDGGLGAAVLRHLATFNDER